MVEFEFFIFIVFVFFNILRIMMFSGLKVGFCCFSVNILFFFF